MDITPSPKQNDRPIAIVVAIIGATAVIVAAIIPLIADWFRSTSNPELPPKVAMEKVPTFTPTSTPTSISTYTLTETISPAPAPALQYTAATSEAITSETKDVTVTVERLNVRKEPNANTHENILTSLLCGTKIRGAVQTQGLDWLKISSNNIEGYSGVSFNEAYIFEASTIVGDYVCPTPTPTFTPVPPTATPTDTPTAIPMPPNFSVGSTWCIERTGDKVNEKSRYAEVEITSVEGNDFRASYVGQKTAFFGSANGTQGIFIRQEDMQDNSDYWANHEGQWNSDTLRYQGTWDDNRPNIGDDKFYLYPAPCDK